LAEVEFRPDETNRFRKGINGNGATIIHFTFRNQIYANARKAVYQPTEGIFKYPHIYETLKQIAREHFPDFSYNWIQVNKNVKTSKHKDEGNKGMLYTVTVGDFSGGELMTEAGGIDTHNKPCLFDGKNITHWTGDWEGGDRYCCNYFTNYSSPPPSSRKAIETLKPQSKTDFFIINEIFRYDIYKTETFVKAGETWLDVGANIGAFTLKCLELGASDVYAYEPCGRNFDKLKEVLGNNGKVSFRRCAVSDFTGQAPLYLDKYGDLGHTIHKKKVRNRESVTVEVLDALKLPPCDGMKLNCEGSEVSIVKRLKVLPPKLVLEYDCDHRKLKKKDYEEFIQFLKSKYNSVEASELKGNTDYFPKDFFVKCWCWDKKQD
jgi:FkbM family methyltransferase